MDMSLADKLDWPVTRTTMMSRLGRDEGEAWSEFDKVYVPILYRFCLRRGVPWHDVEDIASKVTMKVRKFRYDPGRGRFSNWLMIVAGNEIKQWWRERDRLGHLGAGGDDSGDGLDLSGWDIGSDWEDARDEWVMHESLKTIRPEFDAVPWAVFEATWLAREPESCHDVAIRLGITVLSVYYWKARVLKRLHAEVQRRLDDMALRDLGTDHSEH